MQSFTPLYGDTDRRTLEYNSLSDMSEPFAYVLNDKDYETLTEGIGQEWMEHLVFFDAADPEASYPFTRALYEEYVSRATDLSAHMGNYDRWEELQAKANGEEYMLRNISASIKMPNSNIA